MRAYRIILATLLLLCLLAGCGAPEPAADIITFEETTDISALAGEDAFAVPEPETSEKGTPTEPETEEITVPITQKHTTQITTFIASTSTTIKATTTSSTTKAPAITLDPAQKIMDSDMNENEKQAALRMLQYKMDENGVFYTSTPITDTSFDYITTGVQFKYDQKDWHIQLWKGQCGYAMLGGEIGVYTKLADQTGQKYSPAATEEELIITMDVYNKEKHLFTRGPESAWWYNGFQPGSIDSPSEITMVADIQFLNTEMAQLFAKGLARAGFKKGTPGPSKPETYSVNGNSVKLSWQSINQGRL